MAEVSVILLHRGSENTIALPRIPKCSGIEWISVTAAHTGGVHAEWLGDPEVWLVKYPIGSPPETDRWVGASFSTGKYLVFMQSDGLIQQSTIARFVDPMKRGADVVVAGLHEQSGETLAKELVGSVLLNHLLHLRGLTLGSLWNFPHAMSRNTVLRLDARTLSHPSMAMARCKEIGAVIQEIPLVGYGIRIGDERRRQRLQRTRVSKKSSDPRPSISTQRVKMKGKPHPVRSGSNRRQLCEDEIINILRHRGIRGGMTDLTRDRNVLRAMTTRVTKCDVTRLRFRETRDLSVVIPAMNECDTLSMVLSEVRLLNPKEILVIANGSTDRTAEVAKLFGARVISYPQPLGHDVGRSIGAACASGKTLLFLDADMVLKAVDLEPFVATVEHGADIALNDIGKYVPGFPNWDVVTTAKLWLNLCLNRPDLAIASMTTVPHALRKNVLTSSVIRDLAIPPKAYSRLIKEGAKVAVCHSVNVVSHNRVRDVHVAADGQYNAMEELILGDHLEALAWLHDLPGIHQTSNPSSTSTPTMTETGVLKWKV